MHMEKTTATDRIGDALKKSHSLLSIYFTAGYPELEDTLPVLRALQKSGVDMIEIGMPFSDPTGGYNPGDSDADCLGFESYEITVNVIQSPQYGDVKGYVSIGTDPGGRRTGEGGQPPRRRSPPREQHASRGAHRHSDPSSPSSRPRSPRRR